MPGSTDTKIWIRKHALQDGSKNLLYLVKKYTVSTGSHGTCTASCVRRIQYNSVELCFTAVHCRVVLQCSACSSKCRTAGAASEVQGHHRPESAAAVALTSSSPLYLIFHCFQPNILTNIFNILRPRSLAE